MVSGQDTKSWYVKDMGEGVFQIKNYVSGTCIASQGWVQLHSSAKYNTSTRLIFRPGWQNQ